MKYKTTFTNQECAISECTTKADCNHPFREGVKLCHNHFDAVFRMYKHRYQFDKIFCPINLNLNRQDKKIWDLINNRELSFSEKIDKLNGVKKVKCLTVKNYL